MSRQGIARERTTENVRDFWDREAAEWGANPQVTIRDHYFRLLELDTICQLIRGRTKVLDIGCGTGFSTLFYAEEVGEIIGADYAQNMVQWAQRFLHDGDYLRETMSKYAPRPPRLRGNLRFEQANIVDLPYTAGSFDTVVAERVLINLPNRELQARAVTEVARVLQPGGLAVLVEVTEQGHAAVDRLRRMFGLSIIEKYWHNLYVDERHLENAAGPVGFSTREIRRFETFQFLTKVVHPLVVAPEEPKFLAGFNDAARKIGAALPTYRDVVKVGWEEFLRGRFRPQLALDDPEKLAGYDRVVETLLQQRPDFSGCSHQVLFVFDKRGAATGRAA